ncbi:MAG: hypothetical protein HKN90_03495 [Flavobacteriaceae bacterium]|nr:hypothetical protein [Flavobacteriaceae bacterium]
MKKLVFLFSLFLVFVSCSLDDEGALDELNKNRRLWQSYQIKDYTWNQHISCFCAGPRERDVFVVNLIKDSVAFDETGFDPEYIEEIREIVFNSSHTIEDAFNLADDLLNREVAFLEIEYDKIYGFPTLISVDYVENIADDEITHIYTNFEIMN